MLVGIVNKKIYNRLIQMGIEKEKIAKLDIESEIIVKSKIWKSVFDE